MNSGKTKQLCSRWQDLYAQWSEDDGSQWGFADLFIVFAKMKDDKNFDRIIVEKTFGGITMNEEEKKDGIKGYLRQVFLTIVPVPVEAICF